MDQKQGKLIFKERDCPAALSSPQIHEIEKKKKKNYESCEILLTPLIDKQEKFLEEKSCANMSKHCKNIFSLIEQSLD